MDDSDDEEVCKAKCVRPSPVGVFHLSWSYLAGEFSRTCLFMRQLFPIVSWDSFGGKIGKKTILVGHFLQRCLL